MVSHFDAIGIPIEEREPFRAWMDRVAKARQTRPRLGGGWRYLFNDPSGARAVVETDGNGSLRCVTPFFAGRTQFGCRFVGLNRDPACLNCSTVVVAVMDRSGNFATQLAVAHEDPTQFLDAVPGTAIAPLNICAFVEEIEFFESEEQQAAWDRGIKLAPEALVSINNLVGARKDNPARALMSGKILSVESLTNADTGEAFTHASVQTFPWDIDVLSPISTGMVAGAFVRALVWLVARNI